METANNYKIDYGMLAYLRTEDLSRRINAVTQRVNPYSAPDFTPLKYYKRMNKMLTAADVTVLKALESRGGARAFGALFKLKITNLTGTEPEAAVSFTLDTAGICAAESLTVTGGTHDYLLTGGGIVDDKRRQGITLTVTGAAGCRLDSVDMIISGDNLQFHAGKSTLKTMWRNGVACISYIEGGNAVYSRNAGNSFSVYADADEFMALPTMCALRRGKELTVLNAAGGAKYAVSANSAGFAAAYSASADAYYIVYAECDGRVFRREFTDTYMTSPVPIKLPFSAAAVTAAAGFDPPAWLIFDKGGCAHLVFFQSVPSTAITARYTLTREAFAV